jgi:YVTN family beta-propeller protein
MKKAIRFTGIFIFLGLIILIPGKKLARKHVNYQTATTDHPLLCTNCHLYMHKNSPLAKFVNEDYYSPLNLAVSNDGKLIYVAAQDGNLLLVADVETGKVLKKIPVGLKPHSVILDKANKNAYVSNQWSDNVSVIDLGSLEVTDTLLTGNGPAGLVQIYRS